MKTFIQIAKIKAVLLYIMQSFPQGVDYIKLFKILYFAQQDHLVKYMALYRLIPIRHCK